MDIQVTAYLASLSAAQRSTSSPPASFLLTDRMQVGQRANLPSASRPPQIGRSMDALHALHIMFAVSLMRAIVECAPQSGHSERSS